MTLKEGKAGGSYRVREIRTAEALRGRLAALGIYPGASLLFLGGKRRGPVQVRVLGSRLALGARIAERIQVEETGT